MPGAGPASSVGSNGYTSTGSGTAHNAAGPSASADAGLGAGSSGSDDNSQEQGLFDLMEGLKKKEPPASDQMSSKKKGKQRATTIDIQIEFSPSATEIATSPPPVLESQSSVESVRRKRLADWIEDIPSGYMTYSLHEDEALSSSQHILFNDEGAIERERTLARSQRLLPTVSQSRLAEQVLS